MIPENNTCVSFEKGYSIIRIDGSFYDLCSVHKVIASFEDITYSGDGKFLILRIVGTDAEILRENTLNLCNIFLDRCLNVKASEVLEDSTVSRNLSSDVPKTISENLSEESFSSGDPKESDKLLMSEEEDRIW